MHYHTTTLPLIDNSLDCLSYLWHIESESLNFRIPKTSLNLDSSDHRTHSHCFLVYFRWAWSLHKTDVWLSLCKIQFQRAAPMISQSTPEPMWLCSMMFSNVILHKGSKVTVIEQWFSYLAFTHRDFFWLPKCFHNIINCRWGQT